jgi:hypothetical protein
VFKLFARLATFFRQLILLPTGELFETLLLLVIAIGSLIIQALHVLSHPGSLFENADGATLILVSLLAVHFCFERFTVMQRLEGSMEHLKLVGVKRLPQNIKSLVEEFVTTHAKLQRLKGRTKRSNAQFSSVADSFLNEQALRLRDLSDGKLSIQRNRKLIIHQELTNHYKRRFDSVSDNQLGYWIDPENDSTSYLKISRTAICDERTIVTRIFILPKRELIASADFVVSVLKAQDQSGISWAVAIRDYLVQETKQERRLDFSLYDTEQAVSFFNMEDMRYETIFATSKNNHSIITDYKRIYRNLIPQCWLVSEKFTQNYGGVVTSGKILEEVQIKGMARNDNVNRLLGRQVTEHDMFVLVSCRFDEIGSKVLKLVDTVKDYGTAPLA